MATREAEDHSTASGDATHTENKPDVHAGRDSTVWNITFGGIAGKAGWLLVPGVAAGWWTSRKKAYRALDAVIRSVEEKQCADCKACIRRKQNAMVNKRVAKVTAGIKRLR